MRLEELIDRAAGDNPHARNFLLELWHIVRVWDDLIDKDRPVEDEQINRMMWGTLVGLPTNPFYREHPELVDLISCAIRDWELSNETSHKAVAYCLRTTFNSIVGHVAQVTSGWELSKEVLAAVWNLAVATESYEDFKNEQLAR